MSVLHRRVLQEHTVPCLGQIITLVAIALLDIQEQDILNAKVQRRTGSKGRRKFN
jgi:hypothetical protein